MYVELRSIWCPPHGVWGDMKILEARTMAFVVMIKFHKEEDID
jgi:hypothetical protein